MDNKTPARGNVIVLKQLLNLIPRGMINCLAIQTGAQAKARTVGLNDVCDWLRLKAGPLSRFGVTPPSRNALSHANKLLGNRFVGEAPEPAVGPDRRAGKGG